MDGFYQVNSNPLPHEDLRKYEVGRRLIFLEYNESERSIVPANTFKSGAKLIVRSIGGGCGIDVTEEGTNKVDMVFAEEVRLDE